MLVKSQVKYIQSLGDKKFRDAEGAFVAEGARLVKELLESPNISLINGYATKDWLLENEALTGGGHAFTEVSLPELGRISHMSTAAKVVGIFRKPVFPVVERPEGITLLLDDIQDPGNVGTIVRTADWFGVRRVVCSPRTANLFHPKVVQSTMGSIARVEVLYRDLMQYLDLHPGIPLFATVLDGEPLDQQKKISEGMVLIGNEARGIRKELVDRAHHRIRIPGHGSVDSLNVGVAAGIVLFLIQKS
jgi:TrmH family RNA methyltransferase